MEKKQYSRTRIALLAAGAGMLEFTGWKRACCAWNRKAAMPPCRNRTEAKITDQSYITRYGPEPVIEDPSRGR